MKQVFRLGLGGLGAAALTGGILLALTGGTPGDETTISALAIADAVAENGALPSGDNALAFAAAHEPGPSPSVDPDDGAGAVEEEASPTSREIIVSLDRKKLWLVGPRGDTLFRAPIAIGKEGRWELNGRVYDFRTPRGTRTVLAKRTDPSWIPPDWHYFEKAVVRGLEPVKLVRGEPVLLSDSTILEIRDDEVGRINRYGNWWPFTPGFEIIFDGKLFIPPFGTKQRVVPDALGPVKIELGEGYLIHGTHLYNEDSIGTAASHGCIRMRNEDVEKLFDMIQVGTRVHII